MEKTKTRSAKKITDTVKKIVGIPADKPVTTKKTGKNAAGKDDLCRRIQEKAYELYLQRGCTHGNDQNDWFEAERIVIAEVSSN